MRHATTSANQSRLFATDDATTSVRVVRGLQFLHGHENQREFYTHVDEKTGREFWTARITVPEAHPEIRRTWFAYFSEPARPRKERHVEVLNMACRRGEEIIRAGCLYHVDAHDVNALLDALTTLVISGEPPMEAPWTRLTILTNGYRDQSILPDSLDALYYRLETETLDPRFAEREGDFFSRLPNGSFRAWGNFKICDRPFDVRGPLEEMRPIARALKAAQRRPEYRAALEEHNRRRPSNRIGEIIKMSAETTAEEKIPANHARCTKCLQVLPLFEHATNNHYINEITDYSEDGDRGICNFCDNEQSSPAQASTTLQATQ
jgi:hypothetical protein